MVSDTTADPNVLSYPVVIIMSVQGAAHKVRWCQPPALGRGEIRQWWLDEVEPGPCRRVGPSLTLGGRARRSVSLEGRVSRSSAVG